MNFTFLIESKPVMNIHQFSLLKITTDIKKMKLFSFLYRPIVQKEKSNNTYTRGEKMKLFALLTVCLLWYIVSYVYIITSASALLAAVV